MKECWVLGLSVDSSFLTFGNSMNVLLCLYSAWSSVFCFFYLNSGLNLFSSKYDGFLEQSLLLSSGSSRYWVLYFLIYLSYSLIFFNSSCLFSYIWTLGISLLSSKSPSDLGTYTSAIFSFIKRDSSSLYLLVATSLGFDRKWSDLRIFWSSLFLGDIERVNGLFSPYS